MNDPIGDLLIRIKNAYMADHEQVEVPFSKLKQAVLQILEKEGYVGEVRVVGTAPKQQLVVNLKYTKHQPAMSGIKQLSRPSRRLYASANEIPKSLGGYGVTIVSTNQGVMSDTDARKKNVGGELICQVW